MKKLLLLISVIVVAVCPSAWGAMTLQPVAHFQRPMFAAFAPGDPNHIWVLERSGVVKVINRDGTQKRTVLDISNRVSTAQDNGLFGIAFPPDYQKSHRFYLDYVRKDHYNAVDMFHTTAAKPLVASPGTRRQVILMAHKFDYHYGGTLQFGPGGHLYISTGDGGVPGDPYDNARNLNSLLGKILRIDPRPASREPYTVPGSNPFVGKPGARPEIYSYGFRNPFRFSIDAKTNRIAIGDVGQDSWEEVDYSTLAGASGANFGWPQYEGFHLYDPSRPGPGTPVDPIFEYPHSGPCSAVIGGDVVRSSSLPSLAGQYVYTDNCSGDIRAFTPRLTGAVGDHSLGLNVPCPSGFGVAPAGQIYVTSLGVGCTSGEVYRLRQTP